ncbi:MAG: glycosyltransferase, partial [Acidimicrobiales bacterium]
MRALRATALAVAIGYLVWRAGFTGSGANPVLFVTLLVAEALGVARLAVELWMLGPEAPGAEGPLVPGETSDDEASELPGCDVVVVVTDEPTSEVRAAVLAARAVAGAVRVVVVDRTSRRDVAELTERLGLTRLNCGDDGDVGELSTAALRCGSAPFVLIVPADMVVLPDVIAVTASAFSDPRVGVVVGRVEATNAAHAVDHGGYGEQAIRDQLITPHLSRVGALPWWHGVSVARRQALAEVGGFVAGRHRMMLATGLRLQVGGWQMVDVPVLVARRLAAWTEGRQLHRWSRDLHERLHLLRRRDVSWTSPRITPEMRVAYGSALVPVLRGVQRLALIGVLAVSLAGLGLPVAGPVAPLAVFWGARMALGLAARRRATRSVGFTPWITTDLNLMTTDLAVASRALRRRPLTADLMDDPPGLGARGRLLAFVQIGLGVEVALLASGTLRAPYGGAAMIGMLGGAAWFVASAFDARALLRMRQRRQGFRAEERLPVLAGDSDIWVVGVSPLGVDVVSGRPLRVGAIHRLVFGLPQAGGSRVSFSATTEVRRRSRHGDRHVGYLRFAHITDEEMDQIIEYCAVVAGQRAIRGAGDSPDAASGEGASPERRPQGDGRVAPGGGSAIVHASRVGA